MGNNTIFYMFENPRTGRQARKFTTKLLKILDLKSSSEQISLRRKRFRLVSELKKTVEGDFRF